MSGLTESEMLDLLDGIDQVSITTLFFLTSNYHANISESLTRKGRIDRQFELGNVSPRDAVGMFRKFAVVDAPDLATLKPLEEIFYENLCENVGVNGLINPSTLEANLFRNYIDLGAKEWADLARTVDLNLSYSTISFDERPKNYMG